MIDCLLSWTWPSLLCELAFLMILIKFYQYFIFKIRLSYLNKFLLISIFKWYEIIGKWWFVFQTFFHFHPNISTSSQMNFGSWLKSGICYATNEIPFHSFFVSLFFFLERSWKSTKLFVVKLFFITSTWKTKIVISHEMYAHE